jgi:hypothetical protein
VANEIGVLLPVRLETRFFQAADGQRTIKLRIIPDEPAVDRLRDGLSQGEWESVQLFWNEVFKAAGQPATPPATWLDTQDDLPFNQRTLPRTQANLVRAAWAKVCDRVGAPRAAWLASQSVPTVDAQSQLQFAAPAGLGQDADHHRLAGLPKAISVWIKFRGQDAVKLVDITPAPDVPNARPVYLRPPPAPPQPGQPALPEEWWLSWEQAQKLGLGVTCAFPGNPDDLETLLVFGLDDELAGEHFRRQTAAGTWSILEPGLATNTLAGAPAAPLDQDATTWLPIVQQRLRQQISSMQNRLSQALTGDPNKLLPMPGNDAQAPAIGQALVRGLWSALWGHHLRDLWGLGPSIKPVAQWAFANLFPEGPLCPLRIGRQAYGLIPTSVFGRWNPDASQPALAEVEKSLVGFLTTARAELADRALKAGNAVGADTGRLLNLLARDGVAAQYNYRWFSLDDILKARLGARAASAGMPLDWAGYERWVTERALAAVKRLGLNPANHPARRLFAEGEAGRLRLHLVGAAKMPPDQPSLEAFVQLLLDPSKFTSFLQVIMETWRRVLPDSLLIRLMIWSRWLNRATAILETKPAQAGLLGGGLVVEPAVVQDGDRGFAGSNFPESQTEVDRLASQAGNADSEIWRGMADGFKHIAAEYDAAGPRRAALERAFRATLDSAMYRIDPWLTGMAWRRLETLAQDNTTRFRLGVYGWIDGPIRGQPGPTAAGRILVPSHAQALAAAVLRDKFLSEPAAPGPNKWNMNVTSNRVRGAEEIAAEVRLGAHLWEAVGRRVEAIVATKENVDQLRQDHPQRAGQSDPRSVCQGLDALSALLQVPPPFALTGEQLASLQELQSALDCYGDLLVSEAVFQVVQGQGPTAGAALDAAAGLQAPPTLNAIRTPLSGRPIATVVLSVVPFIDAPAEAALQPETSPGTLADPSVAALLVSLLGDAATWSWIGNGQQVTLADLGLAPIDAVVLPTDDLQRLLTAALQSDRAGPAAGPAPDSPEKQATSFKQRQARELLQTLGRHPALTRDLTTWDTNNPADDSVLSADAAIRQDLLGRLTLLTKTAALLQTQLNVADLETRRTALRNALRWGIIPRLEADQDALIFFAGLLAQVPSQDFLTQFGNQLEDMTKAALTALADRGKKVPSPAILASTRAEANQIAQAVAELAAPRGQLAVLSLLTADRLRQLTGLSTDAADTSLETDWLTVVAAVRPSLARLEAWRLERSISQTPSLDVWSNAPADHWFENELATYGLSRPQSMKVPRFVSAFGPPNVWQAAAVAVGVIDAWNEIVPSTEQMTTLAFGFNAPGSRAPQALLLAVPPILDQPLDEATLRDTVLETRALALARAIPFEAAGDWRAVAPTAMFPATGLTGVRFSTQFDWTKVQTDPTEAQ